MNESGAYLVPVVVAGAGEAAGQDWLLNMEFPLGGGINGLAAERGEPPWTSDYLADPRIPHEPEDVEVARRLGLAGMAAAPLRAPGGEVIGTLAVSSAVPRAFADEELDLLQGLADQAAIAITNSTLLARLTESEARYRYLVERAPDLVWSIGADGRLTFLSDAVVRLTGRRPRSSWGSTSAPGPSILDRRRQLRLDDGHGNRLAGSPRPGQPGGAGRRASPAEFIARGPARRAGRFIGANGSVQDMREQERLEQSSRRSEGRYGSWWRTPRTWSSRNTEGTFHVRVRFDRADDRLASGRARRAAFQQGHRGGQHGRGILALDRAHDRSDDRADRPHQPAGPRRPPGAGRGERDRHGRR
jgi:PAS domain-containing protein